MSTSPPPIAVQDLSKDFRLGLRLRKVTALRGISFSVPRGSVFGFLGPNGAGKTTTIKILTGLILPTAGKAQVFGKTVRSGGSSAKLGYLPEHPYFYDYLSGREILRFYGRLFGLPAATVRKRADGLIERVGLKEAADRPIRKYSKGMMQRIGIAQALINDPELVILDEPMSGLDPIGRKEVRDLLMELKRAGKTIFFSSHILSDIEMVCDEIAIIDRGGIIEAGQVSELQAASGLQVEILARSVTAIEAADGLPAPRRLGDLWQYEVAPEQVDILLRHLIQHDASVVSVTPRKASLEELFVKGVRAAHKVEEAA